MVIKNNPYKQKYVKPSKNTQRFNVFFILNNPTMRQKSRRPHIYDFFYMVVSPVINLTGKT